MESTGNGRGRRVRERDEFGKESANAHSTQKSLMNWEWYEIALPRSFLSSVSPRTSLAKRTAGEKGPSTAGPMVTAAARVAAGVLAARTGAPSVSALAGASSIARRR